MIAGFIFGLAWLIFIDAIIHFNGCLDRVDQGDPCRWGKPSQNLTSAESVTDDSSFNWPWDGTPETTPPPHNGWHTLSGKYTLVFVPAWLSMISLFLVNTIDPKDLDMDPEWVTGAAPTLLKVWLFLGTLFGIGGVVMAIWVHIDLYARHSDMKEGPVIPEANARGHHPSLQSLHPSSCTVDLALSISRSCYVNSLT